MFQLAEKLDPTIGRHRYEQYQVVAAEQQFMHPVSLHDVLTITTWIGHVGRSSCRLNHAVLRDGEVVATAAVSLVYTVDGRSAEQPRGWIAVFERLTRPVDIMATPASS